MMLEFYLPIPYPDHYEWRPERAWRGAAGNWFKGVSEIPTEPQGLRQEGSWLHFSVPRE